MDMMEEIFIEDDLDILEFGFPRKIYNRYDYSDEMDNFTFHTQSVL